MTATEIQNLPAGRELDCLVAERMFGCVVSTTYPDTVVRIPVCTTHDTHRNIPRYSTDIAAAWEVVAKLTTTPRRQQVRLVAYNDDEWFCDVAQFLHHPPYLDQVTGEGATAPLAICRAALAALRGSGETPQP